MNQDLLKAGAEAVLAFAALALGTYGAYFCQFLPWQAVGEVLLALART